MKDGSAVDHRGCHACCAEPADYAIEVVIQRESGEQRILTPVRVVR